MIAAVVLFSIIATIVLLAFYFSPELRGEELGNPFGLCKAQTVQLQDQLRQAQTENAILRAQLAQAVYPQQQEASRKARAEAEKEAGCALDWTQQPPLCKPSPETGK